jgi:hypothetical protein
VLIFYLGTVFGTLVHGTTTKPVVNVVYYVVGKFVGKLFVGITTGDVHVVGITTIVTGVVTILYVGTGTKVVTDVGTNSSGITITPVFVGIVKIFVGGINTDVGIYVVAIMTGCVTVGGT